MAILGEMRKRNIFKVSLAYAIMSWLIVQVANIILPVFNAPHWIMQVLVFALILLFPITVLLSWAYELTPDGIRATADVDRTQSITVQTGKKLNHVVIILLALGVVFFVFDNYVFHTVVEPDPDVAYRQSIAIIPFTNGSVGEKDNGFLAYGTHDELLKRLAKIAALRIISRTSVLESVGTTKNLEEIGEELEVGSILEGTVQRADDQIRIDARLVDARSGEQIWADTFHRELTAANFYAIQSDILMSIADTLEADLHDDELERIDEVPTENLAALEAYFSGNKLLQERTAASLRASIAEFERATQLDAQFAEAWAGIAEAWITLHEYDANADPIRVRRKASSATIWAVTLDPDLPQALAVLGWHSLLHNYDWTGAERAFRDALQIDRSNINALHWYSHLLAWQGKSEDAVAAARLGLAADPLSRLTKTNFNDILLDTRRWDDAARVADEILDDGPLVTLMGNQWIGDLRARRAVNAAAMLHTWAAASGRDTEAATELGELIVRAIIEGEPVDLSNDLIDRAGILAMAPEVYAALGDAENTIEALQRASRTGVGLRSLLSMKINPSYDFIRDDSRFVVLLEEVGLSE